VIYSVIIYLPSLLFSPLSSGGSGHGSDPGFAVVASQVLRLALLKYSVSSLLDAPCGAVHSSWTGLLLLPRIRKDIPCFRYHGVDIVASVIRNNTKTFQTPRYKDWVKFSEIDLSSADSLLPSGVDMIFSRDAMQHLSLQSVGAALSVR
jgi:hypothetical protein